MKSLLLLFLFWLTVIFALFGCSCENANDDSGDDDSVGDDDSGDDDTTPDDDDDDDYTFTSPPDTGLFLDYPSDNGMWLNDIFIQQIDGGLPGANGTGLAIGPDNTKYVVASKGGILFLYTFGESGQWTRDKIDSFARWPDIAVDEDGKLHISYCDDLDENDFNLKYATNFSGDWKITVVDDSASVGEYTSITLDDNGDTHIAYFDRSNLDLKYATNKSGTWFAEIAIPDGDAGILNSIGVDKDVFVHIAFVNYTDDIFNYNLWYATNKFGDWEYSLVDSFASRPSLAVDGSGSIHISYAKLVGINIGSLKYAHNLFGFWLSQFIAIEGNRGEYSSIALDDNDIVHIVDRDYGEELLYYITNKSGRWDSTVIPHQIGSGKYPSLAIDSLGYFFVSHYNWRHHLLNVSSNESGGWKTDIIDVGRFVGDHDISLTNDGIPYCAYEDDGHNRLMHAKQIGSVWDISTVDGYDNAVMGYLSLAVGEDNSSHVSYIFGGYPDLFVKYATDSTGLWRTVLLSDTGAFTTTIGVDACAAIHLTYITNDGMAYSSKIGDNWETKIITEPHFGAYSLSLDSNCKAHMCFSNSLSLFYGSNSTGSWHLEEVIEVDFDRCDLSLDSLGNVHIVFSDRHPDELYYSTNKIGEWITTCIGKGGDQWDTGNRPSIRIDEEDNIHIVDSSVYITNKSGEWVETKILPSKRTAFELDSTNNIKAVFWHDQSLWYALF